MFIVKLKIIKPRRLRSDNFDQKIFPWNDYSIGASAMVPSAFVRFPEDSSFSITIHGVNPTYEPVIWIEYTDLYGIYRNIW